LNEICILIKLKRRLPKARAQSKKEIKSKILDHGYK
jgi:hypothetical protein